jgi:hypothetical protein
VSLTPASLREALRAGRQPSLILFSLDREHEFSTGTSEKSHRADNHRILLLGGFNCGLGLGNLSRYGSGFRGGCCPLELVSLTADRVELGCGVLPRGYGFSGEPVGIHSLRHLLGRHDSYHRISDDPVGPSSFLSYSRERSNPAMQTCS